MATTAGNAVFVDANVLVYFTFDHFPWYGAARALLAAFDDGGTTLYTSRQVLREFLSATTRPGFMSPIPAASELAHFVDGFEREFQILEDDAAVTALLLELIETPGARGRQVHDANIAATMRRHGITTLLTHNVADFERYRAWITVLPLVP